MKFFFNILVKKITLKWLIFHEQYQLVKPVITTLRIYLHVGTFIIVIHCDYF